MSCPLRWREHLFIGSLVVLPQAAADMMSTMEGTMELLFVGDDWAEEHHDVELQDETGRVLGTAKLPEGAAGIARLHAMIGEHPARLPQDRRRL
jgi:hypothetical protein